MRVTAMRVTAALPCRVGGHAFAIRAVEGDRLASIVAGHGIWERHVSLALARYLGAGDTMVDVGANVGYFSVLASRAVGSEGRVIAVEPHPRLRQVLIGNLALNRCGNVTVDGRGLGARPGKAAVVASPADSGDTRLDLGAGPVAVTTLDTVCRELDARPGIVKIDVQGMEADVIAGAAGLLSDRGPGLFFELSPMLDAGTGTRLDAAIDILQRCGYFAYLFRGHDLTSIEPVGWDLLRGLADYWKAIGHHGHWDVFAARKLMVK